VGHGCEAELGANAFTVLLKDLTCKLGPVVYNDTTWDPESADDRFEEGDSSALGDADQRGGFRPLGEFVNDYKEVPVPTDSPGKCSQDIHPPYGEWPGGRNHLQSLSYCVYLICVVLARFAGLY
jgi:hypothetical protein